MSFDARVTDDEVRAALARDDLLAPKWNVGVPQFVLDVTDAVHSMLERWLHDPDTVTAAEIHGAELSMAAIRRWRIAWHGYEPIPHERALLRDLLARMRSTKCPQTARQDMSLDAHCPYAAGEEVTQPPPMTTAELNLIVGNNIRRYRHQSSLTSEQLANELGVDTRYIRRWENGYVYPARHLVELAAALGVTVADLHVEAPA